MRSLVLCLVALTVALSGCAPPPGPSFAAGEPGETCHVCRYHNDLACLCVRKKDTTPRTEYHGQAYYFCSATCRAAFLKKPEKYLPKQANPC